MIDSGSLFSIFWWLLPLFIAAALFSSAWFKGCIGETMVNMGASLLLNKKDYHRIKNVSLSTGYGSALIDHIIVSRFGIFVVEIKNMKGLIFGNAYQKKWTQRIFKYTRTFQNPLQHGCKHCKTIEEALGLGPDKIFSIVVFTGESVFATPMPDNVVYGGRYIRYIKSKTEVLLTEAEVQQIIRQIADGCLESSIKSHLRHAQHVRETMAKQHEPGVSNGRLCPQCGSTMVLRTVKEGSEPDNQLWCCSAYPTCTAVADVV